VRTAVVPRNGPESFHGILVRRNVTPTHATPRFELSPSIIDAWSRGLPDLVCPGFRLREPRLADAAHLATAFGRDAATTLGVARPGGSEQWMEFVAGVRIDRAARHTLCYALVPAGATGVAGLILLRRLGPGSRVTTLSCTFTEAQWPTKLAARSLACVLTFAFDAVGVGRIEGRSRTSRELDLVTGLGAIQEGVLRGFDGACDGAADQVLWSVLAPDWSERSHRVPSGSVRVERDPSSIAVWPEESAPGPPAWTADVPMLRGALVTLREVDLLDASVLWNALDQEDVETAIEPAPKSIHQFRRYLAWAQSQRSQGRAVGFAIIPRGTRHAAGLIQVRLDRPGGSIAEWGAIVAPRLKGQGAGGDAARLLAGFAFETLGVLRLESRASGIDPSSISLLRKLGAVREAHLRSSFVRGSEVLDDDLWTILKGDWRGAGATDEVEYARAGA